MHILLKSMGLFFPPVGGKNIKVASTSLVVMKYEAWIQWIQGYFPSV
jgi:hypothetical protein